jgi:23S rRNA (guanosine2251-2'-O)-methyltransferase
MSDQLEGRNPVIECLVRGKRRVRKIMVDDRARADQKIERLVRLAAERKVSLVATPRHKLDKLTDGRLHNGVVALVDPFPAWTSRQLVDAAFDDGVSPFFVLADEVNYEHNLGALLRSGLAFGVNGLIVPTRRGAAVSPVAQRVAMGAAEEIPVVREGLSSALKHIRRAGIRVIGADMGGTPLGQARLKGPIALVMGGESKGLSKTLRQRCDEVVSVPLAGGLESLNVSVAGAILMYEKRRQDGWFTTDPASRG